MSAREVWSAIGWAYSMSCLKFAERSTSDFDIPRSLGSAWWRGRRRSMIGGATRLSGMTDRKRIVHWGFLPAGGKKHHVDLTSRYFRARIAVLCLVVPLFLFFYVGQAPAGRHQHQQGAAGSRKRNFSAGGGVR